jgi:hypothetical protein
MNGDKHFECVLVAEKVDENLSNGYKSQLMTMTSDWWAVSVSGWRWLVYS